VPHINLNGTGIMGILVRLGMYRKYCYKWNIENSLRNVDSCFNYWNIELCQS